METPRRLESIQAIHERAAQDIDDDVRFIYFVQVDGGVERRMETEISRLEAVNRLEEMKDKEYMIKQYLSDSHRYLENEELHLRSLILLAQEAAVMKLYNLIRVDLEHGHVKYIMQYKLTNTVLTFEVIEQATLEQTRAIKQKRVVI